MEVLPLRLDRRKTFQLVAADDPQAYSLVETDGAVL
jgi:hypothetical protein